MKLGVGVLTYNELTAKYLPEFWPSLIKALLYLKTDYKILIGDNSEQANNPNADFFNFENKAVEFNWNRENLGFSKAYNLLIRRARELNAEYFLIINPDTILDERAVSELIRILDSGNHLASVSPKILTWKSDKIDTLGLILKPGLRFFDYGQGQSELEIKPNIKLEPNIIGPSGAAGLFRMSALDRIRVDNQYFDERMFMYKEDCDLAYRLFLAGYKSQLVSSALIYHDRSVHVGRPGLLGILKNRRTKSRSIRAWSFANQNLLWKKHWRRQNLKNKIIIFSLYLASHIWAILFERFLFNNSKK